MIYLCFFIVLYFFFDFFFFNDTATTEIYTLSLHDALPICPIRDASHPTCGSGRCGSASWMGPVPYGAVDSEARGCGHFRQLVASFGSLGACLISNRFPTRSPA